MGFLAGEGYLVRWFNLSHEDRWFTFFTRERGFVKVMAGRRALAGIPSLAYPAPLDRGEITAQERRSGPGTRLLDYELRERQLWLARDLEALGRAFLFLEALEELSAEEDPQPQAYRLLGEHLGALREGISPRLVSQAALLKLFSLLGYGLDLERCRRCGGEPAGKNLFVFGRGGFLHPSCAGEARAPEVAPGTLRFLAALAGQPLGDLRRLGGDRRVSREAGDLVLGYLRYLCQKRLDAETFLEKAAAAGALPQRRSARAGPRAR